MSTGFQELRNELLARIRVISIRLISGFFRTSPLRSGDLGANGGVYATGRLWLPCREGSARRRAGARGRWQGGGPSTGSGRTGAPRLLWVAGFAGMTKRWGRPRGRRGGVKGVGVPAGAGRAFRERPLRHRRDGVGVSRSGVVTGMACPAPLDSRLRRNDETGAATDEVGVQEGCSGFAGMTRCGGSGNAAEGARERRSGGRGKDEEGSKGWG